MGPQAGLEVRWGPSGLGPPAWWVSLASRGPGFSFPGLVHFPFISFIDFLSSE